MHTPEYQSQLISLAHKSSKSGIWDWDMAGDAVFFDPNYYRIAGYEPNEFPHKFEEWEKRVHPDDLLPAKEALQRYMAENTETYSAEFRFKTKAGGWMWILTKGEVTGRDKNGKPTRITGLHVDISEIKKTKKTYQEERTFNTGLINTAQIIILILDVEGRITRINPYMEGITGYKEAEVKGKDWFDTFLPPADHTKIRAMFKEAIVDIEVSGQANPIVAKDGRELIIEWHSKTLKDDDGAIIGLLSCGVDITERKLAEKALKKHKKLLQDVEIIGKVGGWEINVDSGEYLCTDEVYRIHEISTDSPLGLDHGIDYYTPESRPIISAAVQQAIEHEKPFEVELEIITAKGNLRAVHSIGKPDLENRRIYGFFQDITERKQLEAERENLLTAIQQAEEIIVVTDVDAKIQYVNAAFERVTGYSPEEAIGKNPRILQSGQHDDAFYKDMWQTLSKGQSWKGRFTNKKKDGTLYAEDASIAPVHDAKGEIINYVAAKSDISEKLQLESQLRQKHKMEVVGFMAGGMAHNFNNNLSIILGNVELSQMKATNSEIIPLLENAKIAVRRSRDLVLKIITYSRQGLLHKTSIHLSHVINETMGLLQSTLPTTVNLQQEINSESRSNVVNADSSQIQEVLINLCNNAVHAMNEQGDLKILLDFVELTAKDIPAQYEAIPGFYAKLSVQDTGCGMPTEMLDKIFDPFFTTKEEYEGAGMGLSTVQGIVAQHGGVIKVNSIPDQGTVFNLYFPIVDQVAIQLEPANESMPKGTEKILFIDDEEMLANLGEKLLSESGYQVTAMTDSQAALKLFTANPDHFDLVISDQTMPELTGKDLIQKLKAIRSDIPTIICTGYSSKIDEDEAAELGISAFMMKPLDLPVLSQTIRRVLDGDKAN